MVQKTTTNYTVGFCEKQDQNESSEAISGYGIISVLQKIAFDVMISRSLHWSHDILI